jgi:hypothetical protein
MGCKCRMKGLAIPIELRLMEMKGVFHNYYEISFKET